MANQSISQLTSATSLNGTEQVPLVQSSQTKKATTSDIFNYGGSPFFVPQVIYFGGTICSDVNVIAGDYNTHKFTPNEITAPNLVTINGTFYLYGGTTSLGLFTINMPLVETISVYARNNITNWDEDSILIQNWDLLESVNFASLINCQGQIQFFGNDSLTSINLSSLQEVNGNIVISSNPLLTTFSIANLTTFDNSFDASNNALNQASIDAILFQLATVVILSNQSVNLSGGTNAAPSVTGQTYVTTLTNNGCTVTTN
jgi:hypothetical protein